MSEVRRCECQKGRHGYHECGIEVGMRTLVWFRGKDLRLSDHGPLQEAIRCGEMIPLFVLDPFFFSPARARELPHRMQFLLESLEALARNIEHLGSRLLIVVGKSTVVVPEIAKRLKVDRVVAHRWVEPFAQERDRRVSAALHCPLELHEGETLHVLGSLRTGQGTPFAVFTPFSRAFARDVMISAPLPSPKTLPPLPGEAASLGNDPIPSLSSLGIEHNPLILKGGERAAKARMKDFFASRATDYPEARDRMDLDKTSRLSADIKFGTLSIRAVWNEAKRALANTGAPWVRFSTELIWREFSHAILWHRPEVLRVPFRADFTHFPWKTNAAWLTAWKTGHTGYPIVDAAARQLLREGFVHNRARMIAASFLTKHLLCSYREGEAHYMHYLTDGDWAQNNAGWQWSAGCGCDAQPYFRVFNPMSQGEKFDPDGAYVRRYVPELSKLDAKYIHSPWQADPITLRSSKIDLGKTYPLPIVDHAKARALYLELAKKALSESRAAAAEA